MVINQRVFHFRNPDRLKMAPNAGLRDGTPRYMAPEVLTGTLNQRSFEDFKMADIYSIALVLWETCRRCATFEVEPYKLPYHEAIENEDPDYMEMSRIVPNIRPTIPARWNGNPVSTSRRFFVRKFLINFHFYRYCLN